MKTFDNIVHEFFSQPGEGFICSTHVLLLTVVKHLGDSATMFMTFCKESVTNISKQSSTLKISCSDSKTYKTLKTAHSSIRTLYAQMPKSIKIKLLVTLMSKSK